jgi:hypothetical protein
LPASNAKLDRTCAFEKQQRGISLFNSAGGNLNWSGQELNPFSVFQHPVKKSLYVGGNFFKMGR